MDAGYNSFAPPEGLTDLIEAGVADYSRVTSRDIGKGQGVLHTAYGDFAVTSECGYSVVRPSGGTNAVAALGGRVVGIEAAGRKLTWFGLSLSAAFGDAGVPSLILPLFGSFGVTSPITLNGDKLIAMRRRSRIGGWLVFLFNLEFRTAEATVAFNCVVSKATDVLEEKTLSVVDGGCSVTVDPGAVKLIYYNKGANHHVQG